MDRNSVYIYLHTLKNWHVLTHILSETIGNLVNLSQKEQTTGKYDLTENTNSNRKTISYN